MKKPIDLAGKRFGKLLALKVSETRNRGVLSWDCICDCGNYRVVPGVDLRVGNTTSCGCVTNKAGSKNSNFTHGMTRTKAYKSWCKIKERCYNPKNPDYHNYGAIGVSMDDIFKENFLAFYAEVGDPPKNIASYSIDRIDAGKGYTKGNLRWATPEQQSRNRGKMSNNTSGVTGVTWDNKPWPDGSNKLYAKAYWKFYDASGKQRNGTKSFSVEKLGLLPAFALAVQYREQKIKELNALGYGYSENHGK